MGAGRTEPQVGQQCLVLRRPDHRAIEQKLIKGQLTLKDIALGQANLGLQLARGANFGMQDQGFEARCVGFDLIDAGGPKAVAVGITLFAPLDPGRGTLHETGHEVLAGRGHRRVDHRRDHHILKRIATEVTLFHLVIAALYPFN